MRKVSAVLLVLAMLTVAVGVSTAQQPQITPFSPAGTPAAAPGALSPEAVLWDQYAGWTGVDYAAQDFEAAYDVYDIYAGDDFENAEPWTIDTITTRGGFGYYVPLSGANAIHWYIYADAGGEPAGVPGDGGEFWSISLAPSDPQVQLGVFEAEDVVLSLDTPVDLPPGTWWLVYYVSLDYELYGQYGWSGNAVPFWGQVGKRNNPGGGFGLPPGWNPNYYNQDYMFRLEGSVGGEPKMYVDRMAGTYRPLAIGNWIRAKVAIRDEMGSPVPGADVYVEWTYPDNNSFSRMSMTDAAGDASFEVRSLQLGIHTICVTDVQAAGYAYDPGMNPRTCHRIDVQPKMYVAQLMTYRKEIPDGNRIKARLTIWDETGSPVPGADVYVEWTYPDHNSFSRMTVTDAAGDAFFEVKSRQLGIHRICVTDVQAAGYTYDASMNRRTCSRIDTTPEP